MYTLAVTTTTHVGGGEFGGTRLGARARFSPLAARAAWAISRRLTGLVSESLPLTGVETTVGGVRMR
jgi:hypothetical protein